MGNDSCCAGGPVDQGLDFTTFKLTQPAAKVISEKSNPHLMQGHSVTRYLPSGTPSSTPINSTKATFRTRSLRGTDACLGRMDPTTSASSMTAVPKETGFMSLQMANTTRASLLTIRRLTEMRSMWQVTWSTRGDSKIMDSPVRALRQATDTSSRVLIRMGEEFEGSCSGKNTLKASSSTDTRASLMSGTYSQARRHCKTHLATIRVASKGA